MEIKISKFQVPEQITWNYEELKQQITEKVSTYKSMVYGEDQIKDAKKDRANLNALKKALNDARISKEKEYMAPFETYKAQVKEIITIIDNAASEIDKQVKSFEEKQKAEKQNAITALAQDLGFPVSLEKVFDQKWLNSSVSMTSIKAELAAKKEQIISELAVCDSLPEYAFEAKHYYLTTLNLASTMVEVNRLKAQAEAKAKFEEQQRIRTAEEAQKSTEAVSDVQSEIILPTQETPTERKWIGFEALLSVAEAKDLGEYLRSHGIQYRKPQT